MNEKIKELAEQANGPNPFFGALKNQTVLLGDNAVAKFAELIVRECMDLVKDCYAESGRSLYQSVCASTIIEEHFGVEE